MVQNALVRQMLAEMHESRLQMAKFIKSSPVMGADYIDEYPFGGEKHPYKNLANIILWCEYWLNNIKQNDYLEKIKPSYNKEEKLKTYHELLVMVQALYQNANDLKDKIINDELADDGAGLLNYMKEDELLKSLDPNMSFMRQKLELLQQILTQQEPIVERNKLIYEDFKQCLVDSDLEPIALEKKLRSLVAKYGQKEMDSYAKVAWIIFYTEFNIESILNDVNNLNKVKEYKKQSAKIIEIFISEYRGIYDINHRVKSILYSILNYNTLIFEKKLFEQISGLYIAHLMDTRFKKVDAQILFDKDIRCYYTYYELQQQKQELLKKYYQIWKLAARGVLTEYQTQYIELSLSDKWLFYNYEFVCETQNILELIVAGTLNNKLINTIKCEYINKMAAYGLYKILLFFIGVNPINTDKNNELYKIKQMALESLQYKIN